MKKISKENVVLETIYVAIDGTEFRNEEECKKYDDSAYAILNARYQKLIVNSLPESDVFQAIGTDDHRTEAVRVSSQSDADAILQMYEFINPHLFKSDAPEYSLRWRNKAFNLTEKALKDGELLLVGRSDYDYNCSFWIIGTPSSLKDDIDKLVNGKKDDNA